MGRVCAAPGCPVLVERGACDLHGGPGHGRNHDGISPSARGHGRAYRALRATLLGHPCHWCGRPATTADYAVPWSQGGTLADVVPACGRCNYARGAALTNGVAW